MFELTNTSSMDRYDITIFFYLLKDRDQTKEMDDTASQKVNKSLLLPIISIYIGIVYSVNFEYY